MSCDDSKFGEATQELYNCVDSLVQELKNQHQSKGDKYDDGQ
jgi:hypothetical protein